MRVIILGAGIIGITSAWYLRKLGYEVTVVDRQKDVSLETSFANGCQISVSHSEPLANSKFILNLFNYLYKNNGPISIRPKGDLYQLKWLTKFLLECSSNKMFKNLKQIISLANFSREMLNNLRKEIKISYDIQKKGIIHFYTNIKDFESSLTTTKLMRELGCDRKSLSIEEIINIEPALSQIKKSIIGGDYTSTDESGDIFKFSNSLKEKCKNLGVEFKFNCEVTKLINEKKSKNLFISKIEVIDKNGCYKYFEGDIVVVSLGSFSPFLLRPLGINLEIFPVKGHSVTYNVKNDNLAPKVSLTDDEFKLVISRLGSKLRVAGMYEINDFNRAINQNNCQKISERVKELFPMACEYSNPSYWSGLRPMTPSGIPYIGKTVFQNLFLNTGHGALGWTLACGSGKAISEIISGKKPEVNFQFTDSNNFFSDNRVDSKPTQI